MNQLLFEIKISLVLADFENIILTFAFFRLYITDIVSLSITSPGTKIGIPGGYAKTYSKDILPTEISKLATVPVSFFALVTEWIFCGIDNLICFLVFVLDFKVLSIFIKAFYKRVF